MTPWTAADIPPQTGRIAIVTGANRGLGLEIASALAARGATVVMPVRDPARGAAGAAEVLRRVPQAKTEVMDLDVADLASIRRFAASFQARFARLDLLVHNAAAILVPKGRTKDGFEMHFGTNHLGPFALTGLLLDALAASPDARVVNSASLAHRMTPGLDLDDPGIDRVPYKDMDAYGRSKIAALLFTYELDRRLRQAGSPVVAVTAHPGYSNTNPDQGGWFLRVATKLFAQPPDMGALPALYAATAAGIAGGDYIGPAGMKELRGPPRKVDCRPEAKDPVAAARLWSLSEKLTGVRYLDGDAAPGARPA